MFCEKHSQVGDNNTNEQNMLRFLESTSVRGLVSILPVVMHVSRNTTACCFLLLFIYCRFNGYVMINNLLQWYKMIQNLDILCLAL